MVVQVVVSVTNWLTICIVVSYTSVVDLLLGGNVCFCKHGTG